MSKCLKQAGGRRYRQTLSIRKKTSFEESKSTLEEMLESTYWWYQDLDQWQIRLQLKINPDTAIDWNNTVE